MVKQSSVIDRPPLYLPATGREQLILGATGLGAGLAVYLLAQVVNRYLLVPLFCRSADSYGICANSSSVAFGVATVLVLVLATAVLARFMIYRPLLIAVAAAATLWSVLAVLAGLSVAGTPVEQIVWLMALYAIAYLLFGWLFSLRNFVISLLVALVVVVGLRLLLVS